MGWETRQRGGRYYISKRRIGDRVVSRYVGCGEYADLIAERDQIEGEERLLAKQEDNEQRMELDGHIAELDAYFKSVGDHIRLALNEAGYFQYKRGEWRHKRNGG